MWTRPGWRASRVRKSNSLGVRSTGRAGDGHLVAGDVDPEVADVEDRRVGRRRRPSPGDASATRTRARSSGMENGLVTKSSAPASSAMTLRSSASSTVSTMIGVADHSRSRRHSSMPSRSGRPRSRMMTSRGCRTAMVERFAAGARRRRRCTRASAAPRRRPGRSPARRRRRGSRRAGSRSRIPTARRAHGKRDDKASTAGSCRPRRRSSRRARRRSPGRWRARRRCRWSLAPARTARTRRSRSWGGIPVTLVLDRDLDPVGWDPSAARCG